MAVFVAVCAGVLIDCLIVLLLHNRGEQADSVKRRLDRISNDSKQDFLADEELGKPFADRFLRPMLKTAAEKLTLKLNKTDQGKSANGRKYDRLKETLMRAGSTVGPAEYMLIRTIVTAGAGFLFLLIGMILKAPPVNKLFITLAGCFIAAVVMRYSLAMRVTKRRQAIESQLPEVLDLLSVSVEAGLGFEQAINHVINNMEGPLIDELTVTCREMTLGRPRKEALTLFGERCDTEDIKSFAGAVVQAEQLGISIKNVLQSQSAAIRQARKARIQEKASKISVKILIPMVLFIFPVIFIVLLGPAVVSILKALG